MVNGVICIDCSPAPAAPTGNDPAPVPSCAFARDTQVTGAGKAAVDTVSGAGKSFVDSAQRTGKGAADATVGAGKAIADSAQRTGKGAADATVGAGRAAADTAKDVFVDKPKELAHKADESVVQPAKAKVCAALGALGRGQVRDSLGHVLLAQRAMQLVTCARLADGAAMLVMAAMTPAAGGLVLSCSLSPLLHSHSAGRRVPDIRGQGAAHRA